MITKLKKALLLSAGVLLASGAICPANAATASDVLGGLLTTAAGAISGNQQPVAQEQQQQEQQEQNQETGQAATSEAQVSDTGETALPNFDDLVAEKAPATETATAVTPATGENTTEAQSVPAAPQPAPTVDQTQTTTVTQPIAQSGDTAQIANTQEVAPSVAPQSTEPVTGFIDSEGTIFKAPSDMIFPAEMQDGKMYFFSRDVNKLKQKIADKKAQLAQQTENMPQNPGGLPETNAQGAPGDSWKVIPEGATQEIAAGSQVTNSNGEIIQQVPSQNAEGQVIEQQNNQPSDQPAEMTGINASQQANPNMIGQTADQGEAPSDVSQVQQNEQIPATGSQAMGENSDGNPRAVNKMRGKSFPHQKPNRKPIMFQCYLA